MEQLIETIRTLELAKAAAEAEAGRERAKAQEAEAEAGRERAKAQEAEAEAGRERGKAQEAESEAGRERAKAQQAKAEAEGLAWVTLFQLSTEALELKNKNDTGRFSHKVASKVSPFFEQYNNLHERSVQLTDTGSGSGSSDNSRANLARFFEMDMFGRNKSSQQIAHLVPHSVCRKHWTPLLRVLANIFGEGEEDDVRLDKFLRGYQMPGAFRRLLYTGLINLPFNYILLENQFHSLDLKPSVVFVPLLSFDEACAWKNQGFRCIVIAADASTFQEIGATKPSTLVTKDIDPTHPDVIKGFEGFGKMAVFFADLMRWSAGETEDDTPTKICKSLYPFLLESITLSVPAVDTSINLPFRFIEFGKAATPTPGKYFNTDELESSKHPAPHPMLLMARSLNAWLSFLFRQREQDEVKFQFLKGICPKSMAHSCVLFPSCQDACGIPNCTICLANYVVENQSEFPLRAGDCDLLGEVQLGLKGSEVYEEIADGISPSFFPKVQSPKVQSPKVQSYDSCTCYQAKSDEPDSNPGVGPADILLDQSSPGAAMSLESSPDSSPGSSC